MALYVVENRTGDAIALPPGFEVQRQKVYVHSAEGLNTEYVISTPGCEDDEEILQMLVGEHYRKVA
ncbi:MAG: hypothetical protein Q7T73_16865 [Beijerinckiaceae bacterium]|nr:hypothetical protein [Beijerinckiaceae bacterium]